MNLLKSRQDYSVELKRRVDRAPSLTETEWSELRSDIKVKVCVHFKFLISFSLFPWIYFNCLVDFKLNLFLVFKVFNLFL